MKALSVKQPWAELIASGAKTLEIRGRQTHHRGPLAIHASARYDGGPAAVQALDRLGLLTAKHLPAGRVVAVADLTACDPWEPDHLGTACTPWRPGAWAWNLANVRRADSPFPVKGQLGVWTIPDGAVQVRP